MENFLQFLLLHFLKFPLKINVNQHLCSEANIMQNFKTGFDKKKCSGRSHFVFKKAKTGEIHCSVKL
jgi:hypothetical protein